MPHLNPGQRRVQRIEEHLGRLVGEGSSGLFRDARRLAEDGYGLESRAALVWHCAREIESAIDAALNPVAAFDERAYEEEKRAGQVKAMIAESTDATSRGHGRSKGGNVLRDLRGLRGHVFRRQPW